MSLNLPPPPGPSTGHPAGQAPDTSSGDRGQDQGAPDRGGDKVGEGAQGPIG